jgi:hypothetical protein
MNTPMCRGIPEISPSLLTPPAEARRVPSNVQNSQGWSVSYVLIGPDGNDLGQAVHHG